MSGQTLDGTAEPGSRDSILRRRERRRQEKNIFLVQQLTTSSSIIIGSRYTRSINTLLKVLTIQVSVMD